VWIVPVMVGIRIPVAAGAGVDDRHVRTDGGRPREGVVNHLGNS
jgi:hypothetical protein